MKTKQKIQIMLVLFCLLGGSQIKFGIAAPGSDQENPKVAMIGSNTGNISNNLAGGRFFFELSVEPQQSYNFELDGDEETEFDIYIFDGTVLPSLIVEDSSTYADAGGYPVILENFRTDVDTVLIQIYSAPDSGGTGDFVLTVIDNTTVTDAGTSGFGIIVSCFSLMVILLIHTRSTHQKGEKVNL